MSLVVCNIRPSINAVYKAFEKQIGVSRVAFYSKINAIEPQVSQALVSYSSDQLVPIVEELGGKQSEILPGYRIKIIDGNNLAATDRLLAEKQRSKKASTPQNPATDVVGTPTTQPLKS